MNGGADPISRCLALVGQLVLRSLVGGRYRWAGDSGLLQGHLPTHQIEDGWLKSSCLLAFGPPQP